MIFFQTGLRAKPLFSSTPYKPAQAPHSRFFRWHVYQHARRSIASYMPIYAPMRHAPAHGTRLASLRYGIGTAAASALIFQAASRTVGPSMRPVASAGLMSAGFLISLHPSKTPLQGWATPPWPWQHDDLARRKTTLTR